MRFLILVSFLLSVNCCWSQDQSHLDQIEERIGAAFGQSFASQENQVLPIIATLEQAYQTDASLINCYWLAYAHQYAAIYDMQIEEMENAQAHTEAAIDLLKNVEKLDSEGHALLGALFSLNIVFNRGKAVALSSDANKHYNKALKLDKENLRAYYGLGKSDFYKPEQYGGGKIVEENLLKAITLPDQHSDSPHAPAWGKDDAYWYLVQFYQREDRLSDAKLYCKQGLKKYPNHYGLNQMKAELF